MAQAQFAVARGYGFSSWPRLKHYLPTAEMLRRDPTAAPAAPDTDPADAFCRLACLVYSEQDGPERWTTARALLTEHPDIVTHSIAAAAAAADPTPLREHLAADPLAANTDRTAPVGAADVPDLLEGGTKRRARGTVPDLRAAAA